MKLNFAKVGTIAYILWSVAHIILGVMRLVDLSSQDMMSEAGGRLAQGHWTLIYVGVFGLICSYYLWDSRSKAAFWAAAFIISMEDIGFLLFPVVQGSVPFPASAIAPVLWVIGLSCTGIAYAQNHTSIKLPGMAKP